MPARPGNITNVTSSEGLATLNQQIRELHIRIDQANKNIPLHKILKNTATLNFGTVNAGTVVERSAAVAGASQSGTAHASPQLSLGNVNLLWSAYIPQSNQVTVRLHNPTGGNIAVNTVKWNLTVVL